MQANESFSLITNKNQELSAKSVETSLITLERAQKLDLLIHLISNLRQSLVICGPKGIGKTTLLEQLTARKNDVWPICTMQASANLSFEGFQDQLSEFLQKSDAKFKNQEILSTLSVLDKQNQKIVVIIDDAGKLVPGIISTIIQYAASSLCLRVVFSLTHDELHIKNSSDKTIDDCHFIEIPPLTEKQCGIFLQNLSAQPNASISYNAINERLIEKLYKETHGIPGKITTALPKLSNFHAFEGYKWGLIAVSVGVVTAIGVSFFNLDEVAVKPNKEEFKTSLVLQQSEEVDISTPVIDSSIPIWKNNTTIEQSSENDRDLISVIEVENSGVIDYPERTKQNEILGLQEIRAEKTRALGEETDIKVEKRTETVVVQTPIEKQRVDNVDADLKIAKIEESNSDIPEQQKIDSKKNSVIETVKKDDNLWLLEQPENHYTIQLIVLSKYESVLSFLKNNTSLKDNLRFYSISKQDKKKYVLIYGAYESIELASNKMKSLPAKFRKSWVRRFKILQKEIKN